MSTVEEIHDQPVSMRLEVVVIPVSDVDRALAFSTDSWDGGSTRT